MSEPAGRVATTRTAGPPSPDTAAIPVAAQRSSGGIARVTIWVFHLALPMAGLWLLLGVPEADVLIEHHASHFWLVFLTAAFSTGLAVQVDRSARRHDDARLLLVGLGFLAAALFLALHAVATPGVLLGSRNGGFALATPVGLVVSAIFAAAATVELEGERGAAVLRIAPVLRGVLIGLTVLWGVVSLSGLPPLADPAVAERSSPLLNVLVAVAVPLYVIAALRIYLLYRRRRSAVLL